MGKMKKFDPIMYLTPRGRIFVKALRKKIRRQSGVVSKLMANYSRDMKHATDVIGKIKKQVTVTKGKKLFDLDKKLKKWNIIRFKLKNNNKKKVMVEKNHLKKLKSREKKLLVKAPKKKKKQVVKGKKAMSKAAKAAKTAKKAAADIKKVAAKMAKAAKLEEKRKLTKATRHSRSRSSRRRTRTPPAAARQFRSRKSWLDCGRDSKTRRRPKRKRRAAEKRDKELMVKKRQVAINDRARARMIATELSQKKKKAVNMATFKALSKSKEKLGK